MNKALLIAGQIMEVRQEAKNDIEESLSLIDVTKVRSFITEFEKSPHGQGSRGFANHCQRILKSVPKYARSSAKAQMFAKYTIIEIEYQFKIDGEIFPKIWYVGFDQVEDILSFIKTFHAKESTPADTAQSN